MDFDVAVLSHFKQVKRLQFLQPAPPRYNPAQTIDFSLVANIEDDSGGKVNFIINQLLKLSCFKNCLPKMQLIHDSFKAKATTNTKCHAYSSLSLRMDRLDWAHKRVEVFPCLDLLEDGSLTLSYIFKAHEYCLKGTF